MTFVSKILDKILQTGVIISSVAMIVVVMIQIVSRFALPQAPHWTEEVARICFIYMVSFASGLAIKENAYINVDTLFNLLPSKMKIYLQIAIHLVVVLLMSTVIEINIPFSCIQPSSLIA